MLNTQQYISMRREAFLNDNVIPDQENAYDLLKWDTTKYTDWQDFFYGGTAKNTNIQLGLSGGDAQTTFRIGTGYTKSTSIYSASGSDQRASFALNLNYHSRNQKFNISISANQSYTQSDMLTLPANNVVLPPNAPSIYDEAGNLNYAAWTPVRYLFPFSVLKQTYTAKTNLLNSNLVLTYRPITGLNISSSIGYNNGRADQLSLNPISAQDPANNPKGEANFGDNNNRNWIIEPQISYDVFLEKGK